MNYTRVRLTPVALASRPGPGGAPVEVLGRATAYRGRIKYLGGSEVVDQGVVLDTADAEISLRLLPSNRECSTKWRLENERGRWEILRVLQVAAKEGSRNTMLILRVRLNR